MSHPVNFYRKLQIDVVRRDINHALSNNSGFKCETEITDDNVRDAYCGVKCTFTETIVLKEYYSSSSI